jgi:hypothetical protein
MSVPCLNLELHFLHKNMGSSGRYVVLILFLALALKGLGQDSPALKNLVKADVVGIHYPIRWQFDDTYLRISFEYERQLSRLDHVSLIVDGEYQNKYYEFVRFFEWPDNDPPIQSRTLYGWTHQKDLSILFGIRYSGFFGDEKKRFAWFVEPRCGIVWRHALLNHENVGLPVIFIDEIAATPRLRTGLAWNFGERWALEGSADARNYKYVGNGKCEWGVIPELNLCFRF